MGRVRVGHETGTPKAIWSFDSKKIGGGGGGGSGGSTAWVGLLGN